MMNQRYPNPIFFDITNIDGVDKNLMKDFLDVFNIYIQQILLTYSATPSEYAAMNNSYIDFFMDYFNLADLRLNSGEYSPEQIKTIIANATIIYNTQGSYYCLRYFYQVLQGIYDDNFTNIRYSYNGTINYDGTGFFGYNNVNNMIPISSIEGAFTIAITSDVNDVVVRLINKFKSARDAVVVI